MIALLPCYPGHGGQEGGSGGGGDDLLLVPNVLRAAVTSEDRIPAPSWRRGGGAGGGVTLVAGVTAAQGVFLHDTVDAPGGREEGPEGASEGVTREVRGRGAHTGPTLWPWQPQDVSDGKCLLSKLTSLFLCGSDLGEASGMLATGGYTLLVLDGFYSGQVFTINKPNLHSSEVVFVSPTSSIDELLTPSCLKIEEESWHESIARPSLHGQLTHWVYRGWPQVSRKDMMTDKDYEMWKLCTLETCLECVFHRPARKIFCQQSYCHCPCSLRI